MKTTEQWWNEIKTNPTKLNNWLRRQCVGELAAVNLLSEILLRFGQQATVSEWKTVHKVMGQEAVHALWMREVMAGRGIEPEENASAERKYWAEVLPNVTNFDEAMAAAYHAEHMRLARIRLIASETDPAYADLAQTFQRILPHEEWHQQVFDKMRKGHDLTRYHERGLRALNLVLA